MAPTTLLPFLYQTITLASRRFSRLLPIAKSTCSYTPQHRAFSESHHPKIGQRKTPSDSSNPDSSGPAHGTHAQNQLEEGSDAQVASGNVFRDMALGYTPNGESISKPTLRSRADVNGLDYEPYFAPEHDAIDKDEEIQFEDEGRVSKVSKSVEELINPRNAGESTITISERFAFQRIFADLFERNQEADSDSGVVEDDMRYPDRILQQNTRNVGTILEDAIKPKNTPQTFQEKKAAVAQYPPALRAAAARALGLQLTDDLTEEMEEPEQEPETNMSVFELDRVRKPERDRVEGLMRDAKTDFELWDVLEKEVFPLVAKLGLNVGVLAPDTTQSKKAKTTKTTGKEEAQKEEEVVLAKSPVAGISALDFYGPLYPTYLLLALRLLDRSFAQSSALTLALLPKIKSLGVISHVLGGSTAFYNELLRVYCFGHDNLPMVDRLLKEMLEAGLEFDGGTQAVVQDIIHYREAVTNELKGKTLRILWQLPEWAPYEFTTWLKLITEKVGAKRARR